MKKLLLVDFENVPKVDLSALPADVTVPFFFGASQRTVPTAFLKEALKLGSRFLPIDIEGQGKNALDFHIAFYLGEYLQAAPGAECVILSRDKGFDPLVRHLVGRGFRVRRVGNISDAFQATPSAIAPPAATTRARPARTAAAKTSKRAAPAAAPSVEFERARALLRKTPVKNRPSKRKRLAAMLASYFAAQKPSDDQIQRLIAALIADGCVVEQGGSLSYSVT